MTRPTRTVATLVAALLVLGACSSDDTTVLEDAEQRLADARSGRIQLELRAEDGASTVVGYRLAGRYSHESSGAYPLLDVESTRLRGGQEVVARLRSTGAEVQVSAAGEDRVLSDDEAAPLRLGDGSGGFTDVGFAGWMRDGAERDGPSGTTVVVGEVEVGDLLSDLTRVAGQVVGAPMEPLDEGAAGELEDVVDSSRMRVVLDGQGRPRSVHAEVRFQVAGSARLRAALGELAAARLVVDLRYAPLDGPFTVELP